MNSLLSLHSGFLISKSINQPCVGSSAFNYAISECYSDICTVHGSYMGCGVTFPPCQRAPVIVTSDVYTTTQDGPALLITEG